MVAPAIIIFVLILLAILSFFIPQIQQVDIYQWIGTLTGLLFSATFAVGIISLILSIGLFALSGGNLRMISRSQFWLIFGAIFVGIGGLIWGIFRLIQIITL